MFWATAIEAVEKRRIIERSFKMGDATIMVDFLDKSYLEELTSGSQPELRMLQSLGIGCYTKS